MLWDVFCRVIDNFGDIGVCWRLAVDLAGRGERVRLWLDDASALAWMAPQVRWQVDAAGRMAVGVGQPGVEVRHWADAEALAADGLAPETGPGGLSAGDVVVEAFGCDPPDAFLRLMRHKADGGAPPRWINLEYLSAEDYVERSHGLRSPVWSGAAAGLVKHFFYPGFTPATGGLLRERGLIAQRETELGHDEARAALLRSLGVPVAHGRRIALLFCYDSAPVDALLTRLARMPRAPQVLLTPGPAARLGAAWRAASGVAADVLPLHTLPALPQPVFDRLLWCTDLNLVRGEDSAVRALWAGRPHIWQIYEQDDGVHAGKLEAFMARWMAGWPAALRAEVAAWWLGWNGLGPLPEALPDWGGASAWRQASLASRTALAKQTDLSAQLLDFVTSSG